MKLVLPKDFPHSAPKGMLKKRETDCPRAIFHCSGCDVHLGYFLTKIFHPNISDNGDICVNTLKKDWNKDLGIEHVLQVIRCLLINPAPDSSLNEVAGKMFMECYDDYAKRATLWTDLHAQKKTTDEAAEADSSTTGSSIFTGSAATEEETQASAAKAKKKSKKQAAKKKTLKRL